MKTIKKWCLSAAWIALGLAAFSNASMAQSDTAKNYPDKQIRIIVPYSAGGSTDALGDRKSVV